MLDRFNRDYELIITTPNGKSITIKPELRIVFDVKKSIKKEPNTATIQIYNLKEENKNLIVKNEDIHGLVSSSNFTVTLKAGYSNIDIVFKGSILKAGTDKYGVNFVTYIEANDGILETFVNKVVTTKPKEQIIKDLKEAKKGKITEEKTQNKRDVVLVGASNILLSGLIEDSETYFVDDGVINILDKNEVLQKYIIEISSQTGLLKTPSKKDGDIIFETLLNPLIKIGCLVNVKSEYSENLNGIYKVNSLRTFGDFNGSDWKQEVIGTICNDYKVVK